MPGGRLGTSHEDMGTETVKLLMTDTFHVTQVFHFRKRTVRRTMLDHPLRQLGTNSWQSFQIRCGGMIQIDAWGVMDGWAGAGDRC